MNKIEIVANLPPLLHYGNPVNNVSYFYYANTEIAYYQISKQDFGRWMNRGYLWKRD